LKKSKVTSLIDGFCVDKSYDRMMEFGG